MFFKTYIFLFTFVVGAVHSNSVQPTKTNNSDTIDEMISRLYNDIFHQHELPIYDRNLQKRQAAYSNWGEQIPVSCPHGATGMHPHPTDCTKFLNCANGITYIQSCGQGTAYNVHVKTCDHKHQVDCSSRGGGAQAGVGQHGPAAYDHGNHVGYSYSNDGSRGNNWNSQPTSTFDQGWNYQQQQHGYDANSQISHYPPQSEEEYSEE